MAKATARAAVKFMNDKEKESFVSRHINDFGGFYRNDNKRIIEFKNGDGREITVVMSLYYESIHFEATEWEDEGFKRVSYLVRFNPKKDFDLWYFVDIRNQRTLVERSVRLFDIIRDGCIKVLEKFDKEFETNFLVIYGSLDENGRFKF